MTIGGYFMKATFTRKPSTLQELIPESEIVIEKVITLSQEKFDSFIRQPLQDHDFIKENLEKMFFEPTDETQHCIFVTSDNVPYGFLIQSEGYPYARYAAYFEKRNMENPDGKK